MFLLIYEISGKKDVHGLRMRLIYALRKQKAVQVMKSTWLISSIEQDLQAVLDECIFQGYPVLLTKWEPLQLQEHLRKKDPTLEELLIGIVIHSPEVTELGITKEFLAKLEKDGLRYYAILGGVMGRLAILDARLEEKVFITHPYKPSEAIDYLIKRNVDLIIILNQGISQESGIEFGRQVVKNSRLLPFLELPIIQLDRLHDEDAFMIHWSIESPLFQEWVQDKYRYTTIKPPREQAILKAEGEFITRILRAVQLGDKILANGVIIGEVTGDQVKIVTKSNQVLEIHGGTVNQHGIEKLGSIDIENARITTLKSLRRVNRSSTRKLSPPKKKTNIAMLTWRGELVYFNAEKIDCLVSIGDDTTFVSTEILARFSRPVIGVLDGDADGILYEEPSLDLLAEIAPSNSLFIQVQPEYDDVVGRRIEKEIFKDRAKMKYSSLTELKERIQGIAKEYVVAIREVS